MPLGVFIARFYKVWRGQDWPRELHNLTWWYWHQYLQYAGLGVFIVGLWFVFNRNGAGHFSSVHGRLGLLMILLSVIQYVSAMLRGVTVDHYQMNLRRLIFEFVHKGVGYLALALAPLVIVLGFDLVEPPLWVYAAALLPLVVLTVLGIRNVLTRPFVSTYQSMWGISPEHPGNQPGRQYLFQRFACRRSR